MVGFPVNADHEKADEIADDLGEQGNQLEVQFAPGVRGFDLGGSDTIASAREAWVSTE